MRLRKDAKIALIEQVPLFAHCTKTELAAVAGEADELHIPAGRQLTVEGEPGREFAVLVDGSASVEREGERIRVLGSGDFLGEIALIAGGPRTATVTTTSESRVLVLTDRAFRRVIAAVPSVQEHVMESLGERLQASAL